MSPLETFFACGFVSTFAVALLATWLRYLPTIVFFYRIVVNYLEQPNCHEDILLRFKSYEIEHRQI